MLPLLNVLQRCRIIFFFLVLMKSTWDINAVNLKEFIGFFYILAVMLFLIFTKNIETFLLIFFPNIKYQNFTVHIPSVLDYFRFSLADVGLRIFLARTFEVEFRPGVFFISYTGTTIFTIPPFYQRRRTVSLYRRQG